MQKAFSCPVTEQGIPRSAHNRQVLVKGAAEICGSRKDPGSTMSRRQRAYDMASASDARQPEPSYLDGQETVRCSSDG